MTTNNTKEGLLTQMTIAIQALIEAHNMLPSEIQECVDGVLENYDENECGHHGEEPNDNMDGDHESALASAGFGTDESYEHDTPLGEQYEGE